MGIFKTIVTAYKTFKSARDMCCNDLQMSSVEWRPSMDIECEKRQIRLEKKYKDMFFQVKNKELDIVSHEDIKDLLNGEISKEELEARTIKRQEKLEQNIQNVETNKITYEEFFNIVFKNKI